MTTVTPQTSLDTAMAHLHACERCDVSMGMLSLCFAGSALLRAYEILTGVQPREIEADRQMALDSRQDDG